MESQQVVVIHDKRRRKYESLHLHPSPTALRYECIALGRLDLHYLIVFMQKNHAIEHFDQFWQKMPKICDMNPTMNRQIKVRGGGLDSYLHLTLPFVRNFGHIL